MKLRRYKFEIGVAWARDRRKFNLNVQRDEVFCWRGPIRKIIKAKPRDEWEVMYLAEMLLHRPEFIRLQDAFFNIIIVPAIEEVPIDISKWQIALNTNLFTIRSSQDGLIGYFIANKVERLLMSMFRVPGEFVWENDVLRGKRVKFLDKDVLLKVQLHRVQLTRKKITECRTHAEKLAENCDKLLEDV